MRLPESRFQASYDQLPAGSFDRTQARIRWLNLKSGVLVYLGDLSTLEGLARETLTLVGDGLNQRPGDSELLLRRAMAQFYLGVALQHEGNDREAISALEQALTGFHDTSPAITFTESRDSYTAQITLALAPLLAKTSNVERAKGLSKSLIASLESALAKQPDNWELKSYLANSSVQLAETLDPTKTDEAARRQSLLDQASNILNNPEAEGRLSVNDKEVLAKIASLHEAAEAKGKTE